MKKQNTGWNICIVIFIVLTIISFTPLIIPQGRYSPELLGIPYTMWTGFLATLALVILTLIGMKVHPAAKDKEDKK
jgi:hypothetical protein